MALLDCLGLCWFLSVRSPYTLLSRTRILVLFLLVHTSQGYFQISFPQYLQSDSFPYLILWVSSSWGLPLHLLNCYLYRKSNRLAMAYNYSFVLGVNSHLFYPIFMDVWCSLQMGYFPSPYNPSHPSYALIYNICRNLATSLNANNVRVQSSIDWSSLWPLIHTHKHRWSLTGTYTVFTVVMVIYCYVERIWRILVTPVFYNIFDHK